jgi:protocatechuate 3,4-dioxygenase beta subunit
MTVFVVCLPLFSQANQGTIQGAVLDQSGGIVAGATVTVADVSRGVARTLVTDSAGEYVANNLTPSTYTVRAEARVSRQSSMMACSWRWAKTLGSIW